MRERVPNFIYLYRPICCMCNRRSRCKNVHLKHAAQSKDCVKENTSDARNRKKTVK